jgi:ribosomal peptide maturation radical SAM protein 1
MAFRSKTPERVIEEITLLQRRYDVRTFSVVDDILDMSYFRSVLPRLAEAKTGIDFFWEIKANLNREHVRLLRDAGVLSVQPGIESLSDHVLKLMRKGTTAFRNIELLKWCKEYGVKPYWNLLYGFPDEIAADYERTAELIRAIWHLDPPTGYGPIRVDRFSPFHADPSSFGLINLRPMVPFTFLYPFDMRTLMKIAYYFDFDYADQRLDDTHAQVAIDMVRLWIADADRGMLQMETDAGGTLKLRDTRGERANAPRHAVLREWKSAVFVACDRARPFAALAALPQVRDEGVGTADLRAFLDRCVENDLMVTNEQTWLNVAVYQPAREAFHGPIPASRVTEEAALAG